MSSSQPRTFIVTLISGMLFNPSASISTYQLWNEGNIRKSAILNNASTYVTPYHTYGQQPYPPFTMQPMGSYDCDPYCCVVNLSYPSVAPESALPVGSDRRGIQPNEGPSMISEFSPILAPEPIRPPREDLVQNLEKFCLGESKENGKAERNQAEKIYMESIEQKSSDKGIS